MVMEVLATSGLNPNAPMYVPWEYRTVEDFSDRWWDLVKSSPWFRVYWIEECYPHQQEDNDNDDEEEEDMVLPPNTDDLFYKTQNEEKRKEGKGRDAIVRWRSKMWRALNGVEFSPRYAAKAPKIVDFKRVSPRMIQQPR